MKHLYTFILLVSIVAALWTVGASHAHAISVIEIGKNLITNIITTIEQTIDTIKQVLATKLAFLERIQNSILDPIAWVNAKLQIHEEANDILQQIKGGGNPRPETRGPLFVTDWTKVGKLAVRNERNFFLEELDRTTRLEPSIQNIVLEAFLLRDENESVFSTLEGDFEKDVRAWPGCEGGGCDLTDFQNDFSKGGWRGWNLITQDPRYNPYLQYSALKEEKDRREQAVEQARINEAIASGGFLGTQICNDKVLGEGGALGYRCRITRPGSSVLSDFNTALNAPLDTLQEADELQEVVLGGILGLVSRIRAVGISIEEGVDIEESRKRVADDTRENLAKIAQDLAKKINIAIENLDNIWLIKTKMYAELDEFDPGLIYEIELTQIASEPGGKCADNPEIYEGLDVYLQEAQRLLAKTEKEVGLPPHTINGALPLGDLENGGKFSDTLFQQQDRIQKLQARIQNSNDRQDFAVVRRDLNEAVSDVENTLSDIGTIDETNAELRRIQQERIAQKRERTTGCRR